MITVVGQHNTQPANQVCNGGFARQMFSPRLGLIKPALNSLQAVSATDLVLNFEANVFFNYKIFQKTGATGTYQEIASVNNPQANPFGQAINTVDVSNEVYNFQVAVTDVCGNQLLSDEISSILLTTTASSNQNVLNWQIIPSPLLQSFIIYRNGQVLAEITNPNQRTFTDASVSCADEYCYQVVAQYSNTAQSFSTQSCVRAISTDIPPAIQNLTASVDNNNFALLNWQLPAGQQAGEYVVFRSDNGGEFQELGRTSGNTYLDNRGNPITPVNTYCYQIRYTNTCGNTSAQSIAACPMLLIRSTTGNNTALTWTAYSEWPGGVREYVVEKLDEQGNVYDSQVVGTSLSTGFDSQVFDTTRQVVRFRIRAIPADASIQAAYSNTIELIQLVQVHLPDGFTPDGNNLNDIFTAKGLFIREYTITIYNRWGEVVFQSNSLEEGWDGQYRNEDAPAGKYVYSVRVRDSAGKPFTKEGTVQLIR
jgi:gliding motility-associated-like protein